MLIKDLNVRDSKMTRYVSHVSNKTKHEILSHKFGESGEPNVCVEQILSDILAVNMFETQHDDKFFYMIDNGFGDCIVFDGLQSILNSIIKSEFLAHLRNDMSCGYSINLIRPMMKADYNTILKFTAVPIYIYYEDDEWPFTSLAPEYSTLVLRDDPKLVVYLSPDIINIGRIVNEED